VLSWNCHWNDNSDQKNANLKLSLTLELGKVLGVHRAGGGVEKRPAKGGPEVLVSPVAPTCLTSESFPFLL
jgi:hypothetical protein